MTVNGGKQTGNNPPLEGKKKNPPNIEKKWPIIRLVYGKKSIKLSRKASDMFWEVAEKKNITIEEAIKDFEKWLHDKVGKEGVDAFIERMMK